VYLKKKNSKMRISSSELLSEIIKTIFVCNVVNNKITLESFMVPLSLENALVSSI